MLQVPINRPVATSMWFIAISLMGLFAWFKLPVELFPSLTGQKLYVEFYRPSAEAEILEREILIPLESRVRGLAGVTRTRAEIQGSTGSYTVEFDADSNILVRELELRNIAAQLNRGQPTGSQIHVTTESTRDLSRFVMMIQVVGGNDVNALRQFVEQQLQPKIASVNGVSRVQVSGGAPRQLSVWIDPKRSAEAGVTPNQVSEAVERSVQRMSLLGQAKNEGQDYEVMLDGQPNGLVSLGKTRVVSDKPALLKHVADIKLEAADAKSIFRVDGKPSVGMIVFQNEENNLIELGENLRNKLDALDGEFQQFGIEFVIGFDGSSLVDKQLDKLQRLALSGFFVALLVLFLFLKEYRAIAVVAIAVPVSLLAAGAMLYLSDNSLNLLTLCGLAISVGMLVDNSIVVYEAIQRCLERGLSETAASVEGIRRTIRAMLASNATNAAVFLPVLFFVHDPVITTVVKIVAAAILLPLLASLFIAVFLVPMLANKLSAPAAMKRIELRRELKQQQNNIVPPSLMKNLSGALLKVFLRRPAPGISAIILVITFTVVVLLPWVLVNSFTDSSAKAEQVKMEVEFTQHHSLKVSAGIFDQLEMALDTLSGITRVESHIEETQGTLTIFLDNDATDTSTPAQIRSTITSAAIGIPGVKLRRLSSNNAEDSDPYDRSGNLFESSAAFISVSGTDMNKIQQIAEEIKQRLLSIRHIESAYVASRQQLDKLQIKPDHHALAAYGINAATLLSTLESSGREGSTLPVAYALNDGNEVPVVIRHNQQQSYQISDFTGRLSLNTEFGALPLNKLTQSEVLEAQPAITWFNGRREIFVEYHLKSEFTQMSGPAKEELEKEISRVMQSSYRPEGYAIEAVEAQQAISWLNVTILPIIVLLYAVLAITFESLTLPLLVLLALPLTLIGAVWALTLTGQAGGIMSVIGVIILLGLTINPAILLIDRMQQRSRNSRCSPGKAALAAVRERVRPVLMTSCTTIAGLWPLALSSGLEMELWPPFAIVVIGGLITSTLLTLVVIPSGFVALSRFEAFCRRLGKNTIVLCLMITTVVVIPFILFNQLTGVLNQVLVSLLLLSLVLWISGKLRLKAKPLTVDHSNMSIEVKYLSKVYEQLGPVKKALSRSRRFALDYPDIGTGDAKEHCITWLLLFCGALYLALNVNNLIWQLAFFYLGAFMLTQSVKELRKIYLKRKGQQIAEMLDHKTFANRLNMVLPWLVLLFIFGAYTLPPLLKQQTAELPSIVILLMALTTLLLQTGRRAARKALASNKNQNLPQSFGGKIRESLKRTSVRLFGFGLASPEFTALTSINFKAETGMIGIMGPNGAGKTTILRILSGIMAPSTGTVHYANIEKRKLGEQRQELIGYLPQAFGLPDHLTAREYLDYYAIAYHLGDQPQRMQRIDTLLIEVGLEQRQHEKIKSFSGGMRQRVAIARTLLRQPPIIIVDEPTVGLDPKERIRFRNLLARLARDRIVLFSTHVVEDVAVSCERVIVVKHGNIIYDDNPHNLSKLANNMVWELKLPELSAYEFSQGHKVIDQVPEQGGLVRLRVLASMQPHPNAHALVASLEDGYFQLFQEQET